jgi:isoleucyl-tRNA synthetase
LISPARQLYQSPVIDVSRITEDIATLRHDWSVLSSVRTAVQAALEAARTSKLLGSSLQCSVIINVDGDKISDCLQRYQDELCDFLVVSGMDLNSAVPKNPEWSFEYDLTLEGTTGTVHILPPKAHKCDRCWRYLAPKEEELCARCDNIVSAMTNA